MSIHNASVGKSILKFIHLKIVKNNNFFNSKAGEAIQIFIALEISISIWVGKSENMKVSHFFLLNTFHSRMNLNESLHTVCELADHSDCPSFHTSHGSC